MGALSLSLSPLSLSLSLSLSVSLCLSLSLSLCLSLSLSLRVCFTHLIESDKSCTFTLPCARMAAYASTISVRRVYVCMYVCMYVGR